MANEELTVKKDDARLTVIGKSWPDTSFNSGDGEWDDTWDEDPPEDLPTKIKILFPPFKTEYKDGEPITNFDLMGIMVYAYKEDGTLWTDDDYPNGKIHYTELETDPTTADEDSSTIGYEGVDCFRLCGSDASFVDNEYTPPVTAYYNTAIIGTETVEDWWYDHQTHTFDVCLCKKTQFTSDILLCKYPSQRTPGKVGIFVLATKNDGLGRLFDCFPNAYPQQFNDYYGLFIFREIKAVNTWTELASYDEDEIGVDHGYGGNISDTLYHVFYNVPTSSVNPLEAKQVNVNIITVKWRRPYDGVELTDTFEITVIPDEEPGNGGR